jgi:hypothetical protein
MNRKISILLYFVSIAMISLFLPAQINAQQLPFDKNASNISASLTEKLYQ